MKAVAVVGASDNEERYSFKAMKMLTEKGYNPIPVSKDAKDITGKKGFKSLNEITEEIGGVTMYVSPARQEGVIRDILKIKPEKVIFNPGAENPEAYERIRGSGIRVVEACTLVLLSTGQFDEA